MNNALRHFVFISLIFVYAFRTQTFADQRTPLRVQMISMPAYLANFAFDEFKSSWISSEEDWKSFWKQYSRTSGDAPTLPVHWESESLLLVFWKSIIDDVVRIPSFQSAQVLESDTQKILKLTFNLNAPCLGIITDQSPSQFMVFDRELAKATSVSIETQTTKSTGEMCLQGPQ